MSNSLIEKFEAISNLIELIDLFNRALIPLIEALPPERQERTVKQIAGQLADKIIFLKFEERNKDHGK
jgi:hypothetical protein